MAISLPREIIQARPSVKIFRRSFSDTTMPISSIETGPTMFPSPPAAVSRKSGRRICSRLSSSPMKSAMMLGFSRIFRMCRCFSPQMMLFPCVQISRLKGICRALA